MASMTYKVSLHQHLLCRGQLCANSTLNISIAQLVPYKKWSFEIKRFGTDGSGSTLYHIMWSDTNITTTDYTGSNLAGVVTNHSKNAKTNFSWTYGSSNNNTINRPLSQSCKFYIKY